MLNGDYVAFQTSLYCPHGMILITCSLSFCGRRGVHATRALAYNTISHLDRSEARLSRSRNFACSRKEARQLRIMWHVKMDWLFLHGRKDSNKRNHVEERLAGKMWKMTVCWMYSTKKKKVAIFRLRVSRNRVAFVILFLLFLTTHLSKRCQIISYRSDIIALTCPRLPTQTDEW